MAQMSPSDCFNYEVVVGLVGEQLFDNTTLLNSGYIGDARNGAEMNPKGDKVTVIRSKVVSGNAGVQTNARTGAAVTPDKVEFDSDEYDVVSRILAYDMDQRAMKILSNTKDPDTYVSNEVMKLIASHVQKAAIAAVEADGLTYSDPANVANWKGMRRCITKKWGEKMDNIGMPLMISHPDVMFDISCTEEAMKSGVFGVGGVIESGRIYTFAGMNHMQLGSITKNSDGTYNNIILVPNALQYFQDEEIGYYEQRKAHSTTWQLDWDFSFAMWLSKQKPIGAIIYKVASQIGAD